MLTTIAKQFQQQTQFPQLARIIFWGTLFFAGKKTPTGAARPSKRGWSYPITFRSLVVKHTALTQICEVVWDHPGCVWGVVRGP